MLSCEFNNYVVVAADEKAHLEKQQRIVHKPRKPGTMHSATTPQKLPKGKLHVNFSLPFFLQNNK